MSATSEAFKSHRIWDLLTVWGRALDQALETDWVSHEHADVIARMRAVLTLLGKRLENADPYLFSPQWVESLATLIERATVPVRTFIAGDPAALQTALAATYELLGVMATMPSAATTSEFRGAKQAAEDYRKALDTMMRKAAAESEAARKELESSRARLVELSSEVTAERSRVTTVASEFQSQFSAAQESRSQNEVAAQKDRETKFTALVDLQKQALGERDAGLRALEDETRKAHDELMTGMRAEFTAARDTAAQAQAKQLSDLQTEFVTGASAMHDEMVARKQEIEKLVGVIGNLGVTSGFLTNANNARQAMWIWQGVTVASIIGLIVVALIFFLPASGTFSWPAFAARAFVSLTFAALAGYAAREAANNQKTESVNRRIALELEAVRPFIVSLPTQQQEAFINKLGDRTFGGVGPSSVHLDGVAIPSALEGMGTLLKQVGDFVKLIRKE